MAYLLPSLVETQFVLWGAATAASALPLNPLLKADEIADLCRAAGAKALVALGPLPGTEIWDKANRVRELVPTLGALIQVGVRVPPARSSFAGGSPALESAAAGLFRPARAG